MPTNFFCLVIFFIGLAVSGVNSVDCNGNNAANCDTTPNIQEIECKEGSDCTCKDGTEAPCPNWNTNGDITYASLDATLCKTTCKDIPDCRFYKYIERRGKNHCYAMNQAQCTDQAQDEQCNTDHCESGYVLHDTDGDGTDDEECEGGGDDGIIVPDHPCPTGSEAKHSASTMPDNYLRWSCIDMHNENVDIYSSDGTLNAEGAPAGTRCTTRPGCDGKDYVYVCNVLTGAWEPENDVPDPDPVDKDNKYLNDVKCNAPNLILDKAKYGQSGLEIQCVEIGAGQVDITNSEEPTVKSQNNCLLLCDWYPVVNFYTKGNKWFYVDMEDDNSVETEITDPTQTANIIYCW